MTMQTVAADLEQCSEQIVWTSKITIPNVWLLDINNDQLRTLFEINPRRIIRELTSELGTSHLYLDEGVPDKLEQNK